MSREVNGTEKTPKYTGIRMLFKEGLEQLQELEKSPHPDKEKCDAIKVALWEGMRGFAYTVSEQMNVSLSDPYEREEVLQDLADIFFDKLYSYNWRKATPTTYFVRYFRERLVNHVRCEKYNGISLYYIGNIRKIEKAEEMFREQGIQYTDSMISAQTGLSEKVISNARKIFGKANVTRLEDVSDLLDNGRLAQESHMIEKERKELIRKALENNLSQEERDMILLRFFAEDGENMSYKKIAQQKNISIRKAKEIIEKTLEKLANDKSLIDLCQI